MHRDECCISVKIALPNQVNRMGVLSISQFILAPLIALACSPLWNRTLLPESRHRMAPDKPLMYTEAMNNVAGDSQGRRHSLSDWLGLHELDPVTCRRILDAITSEAVSEPATDNSLEGYRAIDIEVAWLRTVEAMRDLLPEQQSIIDDTYEKTVKIVVDQRDKRRKALTLDNGPGTYPTILFSYRSEPFDSLVIAHEFAHALQIRASRGKFVPPIIREICAFLGEGALLSHTLRRDTTQYTHLVQAWRAANHRYFGAQRDRLQTTLLKADAPYKYSWNYPIARYLAIQISNRFSQDCIWSVFEGELSVRGVLRKLRFPRT